MNIGDLLKESNVETYEKLKIMHKVDTKPEYKEFKKEVKTQTSRRK